MPPVYSLSKKLISRINTKAWDKFEESNWSGFLFCVELFAWLVLIVFILSKLGIDIGNSGAEDPRG
jgi:hypothetical protein